MTTLEEKKLERRVEDLEREVMHAIEHISKLLVRVRQLEQQLEGKHGTPH
jgi:hypothetical protein